jgi:hypothetical protein
VDVGGAAHVRASKEVNQIGGAFHLRSSGVNVVKIIFGDFRQLSAQKCQIFAKNILKIKTSVLNRPNEFEHDSSNL